MAKTVRKVSVEVDVEEVVTKTVQIPASILRNQPGDTKGSILQRIRDYLDVENVYRADWTPDDVDENMN
jgi:hypothetical protein